MSVIKNFRELANAPDEATFKKDSFCLLWFSLKQILNSERKHVSGHRLLEIKMALVLWDWIILDSHSKLIKKRFPLIFYFKRKVWNVKVWIQSKGCTKISTVYVI